MLSSTPTHPSTSPGKNDGDAKPAVRVSPLGTRNTSDGVYGEHSWRKTKRARSDLRPTVHMFYESRLLDVHDGLPKWAGYENRSERLG